MLIICLITKQKLCLNKKNGWKLKKANLLFVQYSLFVVTLPQQQKEKRRKHFNSDGKPKFPKKNHDKQHAHNVDAQNDQL